jgi:hypothetical protein
MIEIIEDRDGKFRNLEGRYVLGGLPLGIGGEVSFPGTPLFVERSTPSGHDCRKIALQGIGYGRAMSATLVPMERDDHSVTIRSDYVRFVCDTPEEVVNLINARPHLVEAINQRGHVSDREIRNRVSDIIAEAMAQGGPEFAPALR